MLDWQAVKIRTEQTAFLGTSNICSETGTAYSLQCKNKNSGSICVFCFSTQTVSLVYRKGSTTSLNSYSYIRLQRRHLNIPDTSSMYSHDSVLTFYFTGGKKESINYNIYNDLLLLCSNFPNQGLNPQKPISRPTMPTPFHSLFKMQPEWQIHLGQMNPPLRAKYFCSIHTILIVKLADVTRILCLTGICLKVRRMKEDKRFKNTFWWYFSDEHWQDDLNAPLALYVVRLHYHFDKRIMYFSVGCAGSQLIN